MFIQHANPATGTVGHCGLHFEAIRNRPGIFNVPDEIGEELLALPGWSRFTGEAAVEVASTPPEAQVETPGASAPNDPPAPPPSVPPAEDPDWFARGEQAAKDGAPRLPLPDELKDRPRHRDSRTYLAGHDSVTQADTPE
jgi:hypothetical protein